MRAYVNAGNLWRALSAVSLAMGDDPKRPNQQQIAIDIADGHVAIDATNGHWLARWVEPIVDAEMNGVSRLLIPRDQVKPLIAWLKLQSGLITVDCDARRIGSADIAPSKHEDFPCCQAIFDACAPDPKPASPRSNVFSGAYVADVMRAFTLASPKVPVIMRFGDELDPVWITTQQPGPLTAILMPVHQ
jgi:hypothetical protein